MDVVRHDSPCMQRVTLAFEESQRILDNVGRGGIAEITGSGPSIEKSINETVRGSADGDSPGQIGGRESNKWKVTK